MLESLVSFSLATIALAISPGPDNIYVLSQSLIHGWKSGVATTAGLISGCIVHTALLAFGVSAVITASDSIFLGIKLFGAAYLLYLAFKVYRSDSSIQLSENTSKNKYVKLFRIGVVMNLLNPKVMIFFLAFFPAFLWQPNEDTTMQFLILGLCFMVVSFLVFSMIALLAGRISSVLMNNRNTNLFLNWLQILVFVGIAIYILIP